MQSRSRKPQSGDLGRTLQLVAVTVLAVFTLGMVGLALTSTAAPAPVTATARPAPTSAASVTTQATSEPDAPKVAFLGDSYTQGTGSTDGEGFAGRLADRESWDYQVFGDGGIGYTGGNAEGSGPYGSFVDDVARYEPDVVVVAGSLNDANSPEAAAAAAQQTLERLDRRVDAEIVVVGPFWYDGAPSAAVLAARDGVEAAAAQISAPFLDPIRNDWITASNAAALIGPDGIHPTDEGYDEFTSRMLPAVRAAVRAS